MFEWNLHISINIVFQSFEAHPVLQIIDLKQY